MAKIITIKTDNTMKVKLVSTRDSRPPESSEFICLTCLGKNRKFFVLNRMLIKLVRALGVHLDRLIYLPFPPKQPKYSVCWECYAYIKKIQHFQRRAQCAQRLALTRWDDVKNTDLSILRLTNEEKCGQYYYTEDTALTELERINKVTSSNFQLNLVDEDKSKKKIKLNREDVTRMKLNNKPVYIVLDKSDKSSSIVAYKHAKEKDHEITQPTTIEPNSANKRQKIQVIRESSRVADTEKNKDTTNEAKQSVSNVGNPKRSKSLSTDRKKENIGKEKLKKPLEIFENDAGLKFTWEQSYEDVFSNFNKLDMIDAINISDDDLESMSEDEMQALEKSVSKSLSVKQLSAEDRLNQSSSVIEGEKVIYDPEDGEIEMIDETSSLIDGQGVIYDSEDGEIEMIDETFDTISDCPNTAEDSTDQGLENKNVAKVVNKHVEKDLLEIKLSKKTSITDCERILYDGSDDDCIEMSCEEIESDDNDIVGEKKNSGQCYEKQNENNKRNSYVIRGPILNKMIERLRYDSDDDATDCGSSDHNEMNENEALNNIDEPVELTIAETHSNVQNVCKTIEVDASDELGDIVEVSDDDFNYDPDMIGDHHTIKNNMIVRSRKEKQASTNLTANQIKDTSTETSPYSHSSAVAEYKQDPIKIKISAFETKNTTECKTKAYEVKNNDANNESQNITLMDTDNRNGSVENMPNNCNYLTKENEKKTTSIDEIPACSLRNCKKDIRELEKLISETTTTPAIVSVDNCSELFKESEKKTTPIDVVPACSMKYCKKDIREVEKIISETRTTPANASTKLDSEIDNALKTTTDLSLSTEEYKEHKAFNSNSYDKQKTELNNSRHRIILVDNRDNELAQQLQQDVTVESTPISSERIINDEGKHDLKNTRIAMTDIRVSATANNEVSSKLTVTDTVCENLKRYGCINIQPKNQTYQNKTVRKLMIIPGHALNTKKFEKNCQFGKNKIINNNSSKADNTIHDHTHVKINTTKKVISKLSHDDISTFKITQLVNEANATSAPTVTVKATDVMNIHIRPQMIINRITSDNSLRSFLKTSGSEIPLRNDRPITPKLPVVQTPLNQINVPMERLLETLNSPSRSQKLKDDGECVSVPVKQLHLDRLKIYRDQKRIWEEHSYAMLSYERRNAVQKRCKSHELYLWYRKRAIEKNTKKLSEMQTINLNEFFPSPDANMIRLAYQDQDQTPVEKYDNFDAQITYENVNGLESSEDSEFSSLSSKIKQEPNSDQDDYEQEDIEPDYANFATDDGIIYHEEIDIKPEPLDTESVSTVTTSDDTRSCDSKNYFSDIPFESIYTGVEENTTNINEQIHSEDKIEQDNVLTNPEISYNIADTAGERNELQINSSCVNSDFDDDAPEEQIQSDIINKILTNLAVDEQEEQFIQKNHLLEPVYFVNWEDRSYYGDIHEDNTTEICPQNYEIKHKKIEQNEETQVRSTKITRKRKSSTLEKSSRTKQSNSSRRNSSSSPSKKIMKEPTEEKPDVEISGGLSLNRKVSDSETVKKSKRRRNTFYTKKGRGKNNNRSLLKNIKKVVKENVVKIEEQSTTNLITQANKGSLSLLKDLLLAENEKEVTERSITNAQNSKKSTESDIQNNSNENKMALTDFIENTQEITLNEIEDELSDDDIAMSKIKSMITDVPEHGSDYEETIDKNKDFKVETTSSVVEPPDILDKTSPSNEPPGIFDKTSPVVEPAGIFEKTSLVVKPSGIYENPSPVVAPTGMLDQTSPSVELPGIFEKTNNEVEPPEIFIETKEPHTPKLLVRIPLDAIQDFKIAQSVSNKLVPIVAITSKDKANIEDIQIKKPQALKEDVVKVNAKQSGQTKIARESKTIDIKEDTKIISTRSNKKKKETESQQKDEKTTTKVDKKEVKIRARKIVFKEFMKVVIDEKELHMLREKERQSDKFRETEAKCDSCVKYFSRLGDQKTHNNKYHRVEASGCDICPVCDCKFPKKHLFMKHMEYHRRCLKCLWCDNKYLNMKFLEDHIQEKHATECLKCLCCDNKYLNKKFLEDHMQEKHAAEKRHKCHRCTCRFHHDWQLKRHMRAHLYTNIKRSRKNEIETSTKNSSKKSAENCASTSKVESEIICMLSTENSMSIGNSMSTERSISQGNSISIGNLMSTESSMSQRNSILIGNSMSLEHSMSIENSMSTKDAMSTNKAMNIENSMSTETFISTNNTTSLQNAMSIDNAVLTENEAATGDVSKLRTIEISLDSY